MDRKVQILLDYNIKPMSILSNLYVLDRSETIYVSRLERLKLTLLHVKDLKMWLFKCADEVFEKHVEELRQTDADLAMDKIKPKCDRKIQIESELNEMLECDESEAAHIYYSQINRFDQMDSAKQNIDFLQSKGISLETIAEHPAVLAMPLGLFTFHNFDHFSPQSRQSNLTLFPIFQINCRVTLMRSLKWIQSTLTIFCR